MPKKIVKLKSRTQSNRTGRGKPEYTIYSLQLPSALAEQIALGTRFTVEFTDDGILYRPILKDEPRPVNVPVWVQRTSRNQEARANSLRRLRVPGTGA